MSSLAHHKSHEHPAAIGRLLRYGLCLVLCTTAGAVLPTFFTHAQSVEVADIALRIFPVLFGFLLTTMGLSSNIDGILTNLSKDQADIYRGTYEGRLLRQSILGLIYCLVIILAVVVKFIPENSVLCLWPVRIFYALASFSLLLSLVFPFFMYNTFMQRYDYLTQNNSKKPA